MTKYDNTDDKDKRKRIIKDNLQNSFRFSKHNDIIKSEKCLDLLSEKGVYPYDYMNSIEKFEDESLPTKDMFYSRLSEANITDEDYEKAKVIWKHFKIKNMGE